MPQETDTHDDALWRDILSGRLLARRWIRRIFRLVSPDAHMRCHLCLAAFDGVAAPAMRAIGRKPWRRNQHLCEECERFLREHRGGAEVEIAVLYADVRGSTQMAARMRPAEFAALMQRFYIEASRILIDADATIDKMVGDEVIGLFVPGLIDAHYRRAAVRAGLALLRATGHADPGGPWLPIGVGIHAGVAFVGSIGSEDGTYEMAALGETMNLGARLVGAAATGELVMSDTVWPDVVGEIDAVSRSLSLKGVDAPVTVHVASIGPG